MDHGERRFKIDLEVLAEHMVKSEATSVHVTTVHKVDMTKIAKMRAKHKDEFQARYGFGLTFLPFIARATVEALRSFPLLNELPTSLSPAASAYTF